MQETEELFSLSQGPTHLSLLPGLYGKDTTGWSVRKETQFGLGLLNQLPFAKNKSRSISWVTDMQPNLTVVTIMMTPLVITSVVHLQRD